MKWICLKEEFRHHGYMTEAVKVITEWALSQENVKLVAAETDLLACRISANQNRCNLFVDRSSQWSWFSFYPGNVHRYWKIYRAFAHRYPDRNHR